MLLIFNWLNKLKKTSLFSKLTILILMSAFLIFVSTFLVAHAFIADTRNKTPQNETFHRLAKYIVSQIDITDTAATRSFLENQLFDLRYEGDDFKWTSSQSVPNIKSAMKRISENRLSFMHHNRLATMVETGNGIYILQGVNPFEQLSFPWKFTAIWLFLLVVIFWMAHNRIKHMLHPVRILQKGLGEISKGHLDTQLPVTSNDELGQLVETFNLMVCQIDKDMKSRDQLLRDISHEFRSPLSRMLLALEFVPEGNIRQTLKNNIVKLEKMTSCILEEERLDSPFGKIRKERVDLKKLLSEIVETRKTSSSSINTKIQEELFVNGDEERLRMAVSNVLENAIKYSKAETDPIEIELFRFDNDAVIIIRDKGIGIPESEIPFIFEPFYRIDKARQHNSGGYGLGMNLTKKIVVAHYGNISITSNPDLGTTVTIKIPAAEYNS